MKQEFHNIDKIEEFLNGSLQGEELEAFNNAIAKDPLLANEVTLQQNIQESISNSRTAELKARLSEISVTTIDPYRGVKIAASVITGAIFTGFLGYQIAKITETPAKEVFVEQPIENVTPATNEVIAEEVVEVFETNTQEEVSNEVVEEITTTPDVEKTTTTENSSSTEVVTNTTRNIPRVIPGVHDEMMSDDEGETNLSAPEEKLPSRGLNNNLDAKVAGDIIPEYESEKEDLQYKFDGSKVYLYGISKDAAKPIFYDVYMKGSKKTYMEYQGSFYNLDRSVTKKTNLLEEKDANIIRELKLK